MTDKEALFLYRFKEAEETLRDARKMIEGGFSPRSITNRAYYSMFYAVLALFLKRDINIKTSKHIGIISIFDKEFIKPGELDKRYSEILHDMFDARQEGDYKDFAEISIDDSKEHVMLAGEFLEEIRRLIHGR